MSGVVTFVIHYGYGAVRSSDAGADLSEFEYHELELTDPQSIRIGDFKKMLVVFLGLDPKLYTVSWQALWSNSSTIIYCQLKEIERTSQWVSWLKGCERRETSLIALMVAKPIPVRGEDESSHSSQVIGFGSWQSMQPADQPAVSMSYANDIGYETGQSSHASGAATDDAGGEIFLDDEDEVLQQQMEAEDVDGDADDINSSDSDEEDEEDDLEEAPIPKEWNQDFSDIMRVNEGHNSAWEYHPNSISVGSLYPDKQRLQDAITSWAIFTQRVFKTVASNKKYLTVECSKESCPARVHGYLRKNDTFWVVSDHVQHKWTLIPGHRIHRGIQKFQRLQPLSGMHHVHVLIHREV
jgi:hypothetical protein